MERINETGETLQKIIATSIQPLSAAKPLNKEKSAQESAVYVELSRSTESAEEIYARQQRVLETLGPETAQRFSDLLKSVSTNNQRIEQFIESFPQDIPQVSVYA